MWRLIKCTILVLIIMGGVWAIINRDQFQDPDQLKARLEEWQGHLQQSSSSLTKRWTEWRQALLDSSDSARSSLSSEQWVQEPVLRVATFGLDHFGIEPDDLEQMWLLADICHQFDLIAVQGIDANSDRWLEVLADLLGQIDGDSDYFYITDRHPDSRLGTQNCILFNRRTIELDQRKWYTVDDPDSVFARPPLVGWFTARVFPPETAFTFTVVNVEVLPEVTDTVNQHSLKELIRVVGQDGRNEDDILLLGNLGKINRRTGTTVSFGRSSGSIETVQNQPTDLLRQTVVDNIAFNRLAVTEFTGRSGVLDFYRHYNLTLNQATLLSDRMPVWAEFSVFEGGLVPNRHD